MEIHPNGFHLSHNFLYYVVYKFLQHFIIASKINLFVKKIQK